MILVEFIPHLLRTIEHRHRKNILMVMAGLFEINDIVSECFVKILKVNITNTQLFFVEKCENLLHYFLLNKCENLLHNFLLKKCENHLHCKRFI